MVPGPDTVPCPDTWQSAVACRSQCLPDSNSPVGLVSRLKDLFPPRLPMNSQWHTAALCIHQTCCTQRTQYSLRIYPLSRLRASVVFTNFPIFRQCRHPYGTRQKTAEASLKRSAEDCKSGTYLKISRSDADCTPHAPKRWADVFGQIAGSQKILMMVFAYEVPVSPNNSRLVFRYENV